MPNIEIHGFSYYGEAEEVAGEIFELFLGEPYVKEMVVTIHSTVVKDINRDDQPYLRLASSHGPYIEEILERLGTLGIAIEILKLEGFIPKKAPEDSS